MRVAPWTTMVLTVLGACGGGGGGGSGDGGVVVDAFEGPILPPGDPGAADLQLEVHGDQDRRPISPLIYGSNTSDDIAASRYRLLRMGGNRLTAYNWETNASNAGSDYLFQNDGFLSSSDVPGQAVRDLVDTAAANTAAALLTVPIVDHVAADKNGGGDVRSSGSNYLATRFRQNRATKGSTLALTPDATDGFVNQDEFVAWVQATFPSQPVIFELDNEPDLWSGTHAEIHPSPVTYDELCTRNATFATMIKATYPGAEVAGPASYGFGGFVNLQSAPDAAGKGEFLDYYLTRMKAAEQAAGHRVVDYLDLHWYPEATGNGVRVTGAETAAAVVAARVQAPRSLWDASYAETSWVKDFLGEPVALIPRVQAKIAAAYPGTKLAFTEWNYGGGKDISGAVASADVLGVFGREGVAMATQWPLDAPEAYVFAAFRAFLNYDGAGASFGNVSVQATTSDVATATVYGSIASTDPTRVVIIAINKSTSAKTAGLKVFASVPYPTLHVHTVTSAGPQVVAQPDVAAAATNAFAVTLPPMSISVLVPTR